MPTHTRRPAAAVLLGAMLLGVMLPGHYHCHNTEQHPQQQAAAVSIRNRKVLHESKGSAVAAARGSPFARQLLDALQHELNKTHRAEEWQAAVKKWDSYKQHWEVPVPDWLVKYSSAPPEVARDRFMIHWCGRTVGHCSGIGNRFEAMTEMVRLAAWTNRTVLYMWEPIGLENYFEPASQIDWRPRPEYNLTNEEHKAHMFSWDKPEYKSGDGYTKSQAYELNTCTHEGTMVFTPFPGLPPSLGESISAVRAHVFHQLMRPTPWLVDTIAAQRRRLFGSQDAPYVAMHIRIGGLHGEGSLDRLRSNGQGFELLAVIAAVRCARRIAENLNVTAPLLLITDNLALRALVNDGEMRVVGPSTVSRHIHTLDSAHDHGDLLLKQYLVDPKPMIKAYAAEFVDIGLLGQARCLVHTGGSSFTAAAVRWGRPPCIVHVNDCMALQDDVMRTQGKGWKK